MLQIKKGSARVVMGAIAVSAMSALSTPTAALSSALQQTATFTLNNGNNNSGIFSTTGVIDTVNITTAGIYTIDAFGAQGSNSGGLGGEIKGNFNLTSGQILQILVGGFGKSGGGSGGNGFGFMGFSGGNGGTSDGQGGIGGYDATISNLTSSNAIRSGDGSLAISFVPASSTAVPEPFTIVGTLIGGGAALRMRKKLRDAAKCQQR
jgi:hypothetical protein